MKLLLDNIEIIVGVLGAALTAIGLFASWRSWRRSELRREEVLAWANEAISALQSVRLITAGDSGLLPQEMRARLTQLLFETSILVERGRLFFRNAPGGGFGREKQRAYRGYRPEILDQLVVAHDIACAWPGATEADRARMALVAEEILRRFVTLAQREVGRERTVSRDTRRRGTGAKLSERMAEFDSRI